jgi:hypothetical protein
MPVSTEVRVIDAIDACDADGCPHHPRKWWSATLGISESQLARWANGTGERHLRAGEVFRVLEVLGDVHPVHAQRLLQDLARPSGLIVQVPSGRVPSGRTHARLQREAADVQAARADADEDGRREPGEIREELHEAREALRAADAHVAAMGQELSDAERAAGVVGLPGIGRTMPRAGVRQ